MLQTRHFAFKMMDFAGRRLRLEVHPAADHLPWVAGGRQHQETGQCDMYFPILRNPDRSV